MSDAEPKTPQGYTAADLDKSPTLANHLLIGLYGSVSVLVDSLVRLTDQVTELATKTSNVATEVETVDNRRKRDRIVGAFTLALFILIAVFGGLFFKQYVHTTNVQSEALTEQLEILRSNTGPEAQKRSANAIEDIKCDNRQALVDYGNLLHEAIPQVPAPTIPDNCKENG